MKSEAFLLRTMVNRVIYKYSVLISTFFFFLPSLWAHSSLFFTESEMDLIRQNLLSQNESTRTTSDSGELSLSAIVYVDEGHWALWLNNRMIRSDAPHQIKGFHIEKVTPLKVRFSWTEPHSATLKTFTLRPHQVFYAKENSVISKEP